MNYFKLLRYIQKGDKSFFDIPFEDQDRFLKSLPIPKDDIERSYNQYCCQNFFLTRWKVFLLNIAASVVFPFILFVLSFKRTIVGKKEDIDAYGEFWGLEEIIPQELHQQYKIDNRKWGEENSLALRDWLLIIRIIVRHPTDPYFCLKCMMKIGIYSQAIKSYTPQVIIIHNEPSFTCSVLRYFCNLRGVRLINVMHGEKLFNIRDSFIHFDEFYVWSDYYVSLLKSLGAETTQFKVAIPNSVKIDTAKYHSTDSYADYKYYLALYSETEIKSIVNSMQFVKNSGKTVKYRPHPRYSNIALLEKYVSSDEIEYPNITSILESISNLQYAVGSYTTVLNQAYFSGKGVVCDDVTFKDQYEKLKDLKYILANISLPKLSEFQ